MVARILRRYKYVILYGLGLALLLFLLKGVKCGFFIFDPAIEVYGGATAVLSPFLGTCPAQHLTTPKPATTPPPPPPPAPTPPPAPNPDSAAIAKLGLSAREI